MYVNGRVSGGFFQPNLGLDLSWAEKKVGAFSGGGASIKFRGTYPATMGFYHSTYGGIKVMGNQFATTIAGSDAGKTYARLFSINGLATGASECAAGTLVVDLARGTAYPFGTTGTGGWGGAEDAACRISVYNYAANGATVGGMRALRVYARQYSGGNMANIYAMLVDADDRGSGNPSSANVVTATISQRINGICGTKSTILRIEDNSQGSITPATVATNSMMEFVSAQPIATGAKATCIHFATSGSGSGWTNLFSFQTAAGKEGFTAIADGDLKGKVNGYIKVYDLATGQTLYINCYDTVPST
jgi:hypothetical protein